MKKQVGFCLIALMLVVSLPLSLSAKEVCEMILNGCPESYNGDTIVVPEHVIALSSSMLACSTSISATVSTTSPPPSIMFVIDHSSSMASGTGGNDPDGSRFSVTTEFIDSIYTKQPKAEVGLVVFAGHLFFNTASGEYYTKYFKEVPEIIDSASPNQAYVKMLTLDSTYDGKKGIDILKDILTTRDSIVNTIRDSVIISSRTFKELVYTPNFRRTGTDINLAFYAAKAAMSNAANPPDRQFVIFFSDGEASGTVIPAVKDTDFESGKNVPTTFSVYFTANATAPKSIQTMTDNIKLNGYSESNENSDLWAIQANHDALLKLLMSEAMKSILIPGTPSHMVINGITSLSASDKSFEFQDKFALAAVNTDFEAQIIYEYTDPDNKKRDSIIKLNFVIRREANAELPADISTNCWEQPSLQFYYNNNTISEVTEDMEQLQIRLNPNGEKIDSAKVELMTSLESMPVTLSKSGSYWNKSFKRATTGQAENDDILQHVTGDSIIAIYRNPGLPLDTVRISIPVRIPAPIPSTISVTAILRDISGNGLIDRIDLVWASDTFDILDNLPSVSEFILNSQITTFDNIVTKLVPSAVKKGSGDTLCISINENTGKALETGWNNAVVLLSDVAVTVQGNAFRVDKVIDGTGPVIQRVLYYPGADVSRPYDTLKITLSEPLNCDLLDKGSPSTAFKYFDAGDLDQGIFTGASFVKSCESGFVSELRIILNSNGEVEPEVDSMSIFGSSADAADKFDNRSGMNNRRVAVEWGIENYISSAVSNNPFVPGKTQISPAVRNYYGVKDEQSGGTIVGITSIKSLLKLNDGSYGSAIIYDALGNIVRKNLPVQKTKAGSSYYAFWNGRNENSRAVGDGTYLLIMNCSIDGRPYIDKKKIGVSW